MCIVYFALQVLGDKTSRESMLRLDYKSRKLEAGREAEVGFLPTNSHRPQVEKQ